MNQVISICVATIAAKPGIWNKEEITRALTCGTVWTEHDDEVEPTVQARGKRNRKE
jgi:hypothetical protein